MTTTKRMHLALNTHKFEESVAFYRTFFERAPVKLKPGYAKFELDEPGLNFTLNESPEATARPSAVNHLGIQVGSTEEVRGALQRLSDAGLDTLEEANTVCCYALQDKVWVTDPNGHSWEVFVVKDGDVDEAQPVDPGTSEETSAACAQQPCCAPSP